MFGHFSLFSIYSLRFGTSKKINKKKLREILKIETKINKMFGGGPIILKNWGKLETH